MPDNWVSDKTTIASVAWKELKETAMEDTYQEEDWFVSNFLIIQTFSYSKR